MERMAKNSHDKLCKLQTFCIFSPWQLFFMKVQLNIFILKLILSLHFK